MSRKKMIWYIVGLIGIVALVYIFIGARHIIQSTGAFKTFTPHFAGTCQKIDGIIGAEDITIDKQGIAWISATDRRGILAGKKVRGQIAIMDLNKKLPTLRDITPDSPSDFRPHGISLFTDQDGQRYLFAVNHTSDGKHSIERFKITAAGKLEHNARFQSPALFSPNDIVAVGAAQFYATNDLGSDPDGFTRTLEIIFGLAWGSLAFFDGQQGKIIMDDLSFPNGINKSADGKTIYMAELSAHQVRVFDRDLATNALTLRDTIFADSAIDNLELDASGDLWTAGHPKFFESIEHFTEGGIAPTQVLRISPRTREVEEIYYNDGEAISAAATAAPYKNRFVIGPVLDPHILICDRRP